MYIIAINHRSNPSANILKNKFGTVKIRWDFLKVYHKI